MNGLIENWAPSVVLSHINNSSLCLDLKKVITNKWMNELKSEVMSRFVYEKIVKYSKNTSSYKYIQTCKELI